MDLEAAHDINHASAGHPLTIDFPQRLNACRKHFDPTVRCDEEAVGLRPVDF